ncbi:MAG: hypothetical protein H0W08_25375, partial [Acidobacteria bacterium]|nr:hypothetical protein [Acidobacteriota bacterium]
MKARAILATAALLYGSTALTADVPKGLETFDAVWSIVRDTHFDKSFNGVDWDAARAEFRPKAAAATTPGELRSLLHNMLGRLGQSHFSVIPGSVAGSADGTASGSATPGFDFRIVTGQVLVTQVEPGSGAASAGVRPGWRLTSIAGRPVDDLLKALQEMPDDRVRHLEAWRGLHGRLRGQDGAEVSLSFEDGAGVVITRSIARWQQQGQPVTVG